MAFRFNKRIRLGKGLGLNVSKSGMTPSYKSKKGSVSSKGFSVRTGIPGLTFRKSFKSKGCIGILCLFLVIPLFFASCSTDAVDDCKCSDFSSQTSAQSAFDGGSCGGELDRDNDGIACENLPN